jgi:hypothetical protein
MQNVKIDLLFEIKKYSNVLSFHHNMYWLDACQLRTQFIDLVYDGFACDTFKLSRSSAISVRKSRMRSLAMSRAISNDSFASDAVKQTCKRG